MMTFKHKLLAAALVSSSLAAQASTVNLVADGQWQSFGVDSFASQSGGNEWIDNANTNDPGYGSALTFTFTVAAGYQGTLTVVDADLAGDTFRVFNNGDLLGTTSSVPEQQYGGAPDVGYDFDAALANNAFSHGAFSLSAGSYSISGALAQSVLLGSDPLNATAGAVMLTVSAVPEPSSAVLVLAALGACAFTSRRRTGH